MKKEHAKVKRNSAWQSVAITAAIATVFLINAAALHAQGTLDPASGECISCHEAFIDPEFPGLVCHAEGCNHAIGVDYYEAATRRPALAKPGELDTRVKLVNGRIGCTTCHMPYSEADHQTLSQGRTDGADPLLVVENQGSSLCLVCHRM